MGIKKIIVILIFISSFMLSSEEQKSNVSKECAALEKSNIIFMPLASIISFKLKDGITTCEVGRNMATFEFKNGRLVKYKEVATEDNELIFYGEYGFYGLTGEVYINEGYGFGYPNSMRVNFVKGKAKGKLIEYYSNGNVYRESTINSNTRFAFDTDYKKYIEGKYKIYDIKDGKEIYSGEIIKGTGKVVEYWNNGKIKEEYTLKNHKIEGVDISYNEDGSKFSEVYHFNNKIIKQVQYHKDGNRSEYDDTSQTMYNRNNQLVFISLKKENVTRWFNDDGTLLEEKKWVISNNREVRRDERYYKTGELKYRLDVYRNYKLYDKKGNIIFQTEIRTGNEEIKYVNGLSNGEVTIGVTKLENYSFPKEFRFFVNCGGQKLSLSIMKCVTE